MIESLLRGIFLALLLAISVGPVVFAILKQSIDNGHNGGISFILGVSASDIMLVVLSNAFTTVFDSIKRYSNELGIIGCTMLVIMGIYFLFFKKAKTSEEGKPVMVFRKRDYAKIFLSGFFMNCLNPAVILFWFTWATAFAVMNLTDKIILFSTCLGLNLLFDFAKVFLANRIRTRLTSHNILVINRISGLILIGFGLFILWGIVFLKHTHLP
jgi:threonine/homoserine/homoserine lactone efflux protein